MFGNKLCATIVQKLWPFPISFIVAVATVGEDNNSALYIVHPEIVPHDTSSCFTLKYGVPQGSVKGPHLFRACKFSVRSPCTPRGFSSEFILKFLVINRPLSRRKH